MNTLHKTPHLRRVFTFVALLATLGLSTLGLSQCRMIDDTVTGLNGRSGSLSGEHDGDDDNDRNDPGGHRRRCKARCRDRFKECREKADQQFRMGLRHCDRLPTREKRHACKEAEERAQKARFAECVKQLIICEKNCKYREGSGTGGR